MEQELKDYEEALFSHFLYLNSSKHEVWCECQSTGKVYLKGKGCSLARAIKVAAFYANLPKDEDEDQAGYKNYEQQQELDEIEQEALIARQLKLDVTVTLQAQVNNTWYSPQFRSLIRKELKNRNIY